MICVSRVAAMGIVRHLKNLFKNQQLVTIERNQPTNRLESNDVQQRKQKNPDKVHEVPVQTTVLHKVSPFFV